MNISPDTRPIFKHSSRVWKWAAAAGVWLVIFGLLYWYMPISNLPIPNADYWNDKATDVITLVAAFAAAILGIRLTRHFQPSEPPHRIWLTFTLGWWAWVGGELAGFFYDYYYWFTDFPEFTVIDVFWLLGYVFFGLSLYYQFRLIYSYKRGRKSALYLSFIVIALLLALGLTQLALAAGLGEGTSWGALYLAVVYPVFDLVEGAAALWLFFLFGRGYLGRPWWGLIAFAVADAINIFFWMGGYNWISDPAYYQLDLFSNVTYVAGYLVTALAFLAANERIERGVIAGFIIPKQTDFTP
jgi:hypothetical protein